MPLPSSPVVAGLESEAYERMDWKYRKDWKGRRENEEDRGVENLARRAREVSRAEAMILAVLDGFGE